MFKKIVTLRYMRATLLILVLTISFILPVLYLADNIESGIFDGSVKNVEKLFNLENTPSLVTKVWKKIGEIITRPQQKTAATLVGSKATVRDVKGAQVIGYQNIYMTGEMANADSNATSVSQAKSIIFNLPPRNRRFVGRKNSLVKIKKQLNEQKLGIITQAISGSGGIGKTQLAAEFAYRAAEKKEYSVIFWVSAETANSIDRVYREFAKFLQIDIRGLGYNEIQSLVHRELAEKHGGSRVLFILDNVSNYEKILGYMRELNKQLLANFTLHILITSRSQHWPEKPLILDIFTPQEALMFAKKHLPGEDERSLIRLTGALHYYPLALNQAIAYIKQHTNINDYLTIYSIKKKDYLNRFSGDRNQYKESLWRTWHIALTKLSDLAKEILFISSYLYPDEIPITFFDNLSIERRGDAIEDLRKHSFITLINNNRSFKIHRLLQEVIRVDLVNDDKNNNTEGKNADVGKEYSELLKAMNLIKNKFEFNYIDNSKWRLHQQYLNHVQSIAEYGVVAGGEFFYKGMQLYFQIAMYLTYIVREDKAAEKIWKKILLLVRPSCEVDESFKLVLAGIYTNLSYIMRRMGLVEDANKYIKKAISIYESKIPINSINVRRLLPCLRWGKNLSLYDGLKCDYSFAIASQGHIMKNLARFNEAIRFYREALKILKECGQSKYTMIYKISYLHSFGELSIYCEDLDASKRLLDEAKIVADKYFPIHMEGAYAYERAAILLYYAGLYSVAKEHIEKALVIKETILSKDHYRIAEAKTMMGMILCVSGYIEEGMAVLKQAEITFNKNFKENYNLIPFYINMSYALELYKEYDDALKYLIKAYSLVLKNKKTYSLYMHQISPIEKLPLAVEVGNSPYYRRALNLTEKIFGKEHSRAVRYHYLLGQVFKNTRNKFQARKHYQKALEIANKQHFDDEILIVGHQKNIKIIQEALGKL